MNKLWGRLRTVTHWFGAECHLNLGLHASTIKIRLVYICLETRKRSRAIFAWLNWPSFSRCKKTIFGKEVYYKGSRGRHTCKCSVLCHFLPEFIRHPSPSEQVDLLNSWWVLTRSHLLLPGSITRCTEHHKELRRSAEFDSLARAQCQGLEAL